MADDKKGDKKGGGLDAATGLTYLLAALFLISIIVARLRSYFAGWRDAPWRSVWTSILNFFVSYLFPFIQAYLLILAVFAAVGIAYNLKKLREINIEEREIFGMSNVGRYFQHGAAEVRNDRWERVLALSNSVNSSDWRQAIIEADVMLDELLRSGGYHGDSVGEMLKSVEPSDMLSINAAWEAHKVRNNIAHAGANFQLNEREAKHTIALFESVFKEFNMI